MLLDVAAQYPDGRPDRVIAATGAVLEERPDDVVAFIRAMIRAYWFLRTMPENIGVTTAVERRLRRHSPDPDEPGGMLQFGSPEHAERMPFPIDGNATVSSSTCARRSRSGRCPSTSSRPRSRGSTWRPRHSRISPHATS